MRKLSLFILLSIFFAIGCDKDFEEINDNPNEPSSVPSGLLTADIVRVLGNSMYSTFVGGDMGSCWGQHWSKVQYNDEERYVPRGTVITDLVWKNIYESVISDARSMQKIATEEGNKNMQGVALVLQAYGYALLTDVFGDIPFSEAMKADEGIFSPKYDKQEDVYTGVLQMLDEANTLLTADGATITATSDLVYGGDYMKWKKFANSLKFRCLMRISGKKM
ncbi:MAG: SusD/RagB family nutrient-binding outer membrane lipoprotein [Sphingobacteriales bacterium]|nr:SusD/RagB family nutrient-binding outer membrane lipoprotein [Sphingobacteriales bacterium]